MEYYDGYDYQGYQDPYAQDPYAQDPGYGGYYDEYGYDTFQPDGSPPPPPDKDWEDPVLLNQTYLEKIKEDIVLQEYKGLNDLNMYLVEVLVSGFEIKNEIADSEPFKDKSDKDFYTSVKILHYPFLEVGDSMTRMKLVRKKSKSERVPSYTDLFQTVYTEADPRVSVASVELNNDVDEIGESSSESSRDTLRVSMNERQPTVKDEGKEEPEKQTKSYSLDMGKNVLFTMTGLAMLQTIMKHEIRVRVSERVTANAAEAEADEADSPRTSTEHSARTGTVGTSRRDSPKSSQDSQRKSTGPDKRSFSDDVIVSVEGATLGTASVRLADLYHQAVLEAARPNASPPFHAPESRTEEYHSLIDSEGEEIGTVGLSVFLTCLGRAAVNCVRETKNERYEFEHTLFLNKKRFEPSKKAEEPPKINAQFAKYLLELGPAIPVSKTSTEILQECLNKNLIQDNNSCKPHQIKVHCDWSTIARKVNFTQSSMRTTEETIPDLEEEISQYLNRQWVDLKRICREMRETMVDDEWDGPKEKSLYDRLEEVRMPVDDSIDVKEEIETDSDEEIPQQRKSSLITSRSHSTSLKSNSSPKKTI